MNARNDTPTEVEQSWIQSRLEASHSSLTQVERIAWGLALLCYVAGDMATTAYGLHMGAVELSTGGLWLLETFGVWGGMLIGKSVLIGVSWAFFAFSPQRYRIVFPSLLAALGAVVTGLNSYVVFLLLGWI